MKVRYLGVAFLCVVLLMVSACDTQEPVVTPTAVVGVTPLVERPTAEAALPTESATSSAAPATEVAAQGTATKGTVSGGEDGPLVLQPVRLETSDLTRTGNFTVERTVSLPPGFGIKVFAAGLEHVRKLAFSPDGVLYATVRAEGRIVSLPDANGDGEADEVKTFADGMVGVHGLAFRKGSLYAANETTIYRLTDTDGDRVADKREELVTDLPTGGVGRAGGNHTTRTIIFGPDDKLYVSIGSSCNVCVEEDERRAAISRYTPEGEFEKVYARGLRNSVGILFHPITGEFWAVNNGRDELGPDTPPESIYKVKEDGNYGWPFCYGERVPDTTQQVPPGYCEKTEVPEFTIQAHSAPLGLAFYMADAFPEQFKGDMFVGSHGSWDRQVRIGYKLLRVRFKDNQPDKGAGNLMVEDFATGWLLNEVSGEHWGRPVDPLVGPDGALYLTDDAAMAVYKIYYKGE